jgi:hypothetical protein
MTLRDIGEIGCNVSIRYVYLAILHILGMYEQDVVDEVFFLEQDSTYQSVEVAACY